MTTRDRRFLAALAGASLSLLPRAGFPQVPETFENLKVLPKEIAREELVQTMRGFAFALGVRCEHCHVRGSDAMDFASDEKAPKETARHMLRMLRDVNEGHLAKLEGSTLRATCFTCHRGVPRPEPVESLIATEIRTAGVDAGIARYRELRERYLESGSYSFAVTPLNLLAESLLDEKKPAEAVAVLELNAEFHPDSGWLQDLLGEASLQAGDRERARAAFEKSLSINPENRRTREKLEALKAAEPR